MRKPFLSVQLSFLLNTFKLLRAARGHDELLPVGNRRPYDPGGKSRLGGVTLVIWRQSVPHTQQEVEASIHCVLSIQEAIPVEKTAAATNAQFAVLFGPNILGRLPTTGHDRVRLTMLHVLGRSCSSADFARI
jgi:hypothetical protein